MAVLDQSRFLSRHLMNPSASRPAFNPVVGAFYLFQGVRLLRRPGLRRYVLIPLLVNILLFSGAIWYGVSQFEGLMTWMQGGIPGWLHWLEWLLWPLFMAALLIIVFYSFTLIANLIASPFNGLLAEKAEALLTGRTASSEGDWAKLVRELPKTLAEEVWKLLYAVLWSIPFLILAFVIPVIGPLLWFLFTAWMLAVQYSDFPMGNHGLRFKAMRQRLRSRPVLSLSFGAAAAGLTMIPVVNFISVPAGVVGATALWVGEFADT